MPDQDVAAGDYDIELKLDLNSRSTPDKMQGQRRPLSTPDVMVSGTKDVGLASEESMEEGVGG